MFSYHFGFKVFSIRRILRLRVTCLYIEGFNMVTALTGPNKAPEHGLLGSEHACHARLP